MPIPVTARPMMMALTLRLVAAAASASGMRNAIRAHGMRAAKPKQRPSTKKIRTNISAPYREHRLEVVLRVGTERGHRVRTRDTRKLRKRLRYHLGELLGIADAYQRDEVPLAGHRERLRHPVELGELATQRAERFALRVDQDDRVRHAPEDTARRQLSRPRDRRRRRGRR